MAKKKETKKVEVEEPQIQEEVVVETPPVVEQPRERKKPKDEWEIRDRDKKNVSKILNKLRLKMGKNYDFVASRHGATFVLELDKKFEDKVLELFIKNRINVQGA